MACRLVGAQCQAIIWTNVEIFLIGPLGTNFSEISIKIYIFSFKKMHLKMSSAKWQPFFPSLNVLITASEMLPYNLCHIFNLVSCDNTFILEFKVHDESPWDGSFFQKKDPSRGLSSWNLHKFSPHKQPSVLGSHQSGGFTVKKTRRGELLWCLLLK